MVSKNFNKRNILLIDDDEATHLLMKEIFKNTNSRLISAKNGEEGIKKYSEYDVDLVLLDINMPGMDGYETLTKLKQIDYDVDVVMCTASSDSYKKAYDVGAIAYITKPFDIDKMLHIIDVLFKIPKV
jgi:two-component system response regulator VanR